MNIYPHSSPIILNDSIFTSYGGQTGTSSASLRNACYLIAEQQTSNYIGTFLLPTTITGSVDYFYNLRGSLSTDYGYVNKLLWMRVLDTHGDAIYGLTGTHSFASIAEDTFGYIYVEQLYNYWNCSYWGNTEYKFQYAYEAGLPTGVANQPGMLTALTTAAQLVLNELQLIPANETTGDAGITDFSSLQYSEKRKAWKNTAFGASPKSAWVAHMIDSTIKKARRAVILGR